VWADDARTLAVKVDEGPLYRLRTIVLATASAADSARFAAVLPLRVGDVASPREVAAAVTAALTAVVEDGHPYAEFGVGGWEADSGGVDLRLSGVLGPEVTISGVRIEGLRATRPEVALKALGRMAGEPYELARAEGGRDRLAQLGLFRSVTYEGLEGEADWRQARLVYRVSEPRYNAFEGALGVQGDAGLAGLARLDLGNLAGTGRALGLSWRSPGRGRSDYGARYVEPMVLGAPLRLELAARQELQDSTWTRTRWGGRATYALSGRDHFEAGYEGERVVQPAGTVSEARIQRTLFGIERDGRDQPLAPRRGTRMRLAGSAIRKSESLRPEGSRDAQAGTVDGVVQWHLPLGGASGISLDLGGAARFSSEEVIPDYDRYPLGGTATLRGYDEEQFRVDRYALSRLEWSRFLGAGGQRAFLFWDHALMWSREAVAEGGTTVESLSRDGVGVGLRLETAGGIIGVDYGVPPGRPPLEGKIHLRLVSVF
jgi:outer membrane protein assembly factor BamA